MNASMQAKLIDSAEMFIQLFTDLSFLFLTISFLVAIINIKLPAEKIQGLLGGKKGRGYFMAAGLGAVTPFCSCSTIPMLIGLLKARAGFGPTMTFLFTSPLLNPVVIALFIPVLGLKVTIAYATLALITSISAGVALQHFNFDRFIKQELLKTPALTDSPPETETSCCEDSVPKIETTCCDSSTQDTEEAACCDNKAPETPSMWVQAWRESWSLFSTMFPYMFVAMLIGAAVHGFVPTDFFASVASADNPAAVPSAALIGIPLYVRVTTLLPLVGSFIAKGVSIGAIIALVIGSGGASLPEMILLQRLFKWPLLAAFLAVIFSMAVIGGYSFNLLFS